MVEYHRPSKGVIIKAPFIFPVCNGIAGKCLKNEVTFPADAPAFWGAEKQRALMFSQEEKRIIFNQ
jgi:hypothetical protein